MTNAYCCQLKLGKKFARLQNYCYFCSIKQGNRTYHVTMTNHDIIQSVFTNKGKCYDGTPLVMGVLNCTPDSFFAGSRKQTEAEIAARAEQILSEGGSIIDIGAFSTRPGAEVVTEEEEKRRMSRALRIVRDVYPNAVVSVDTYRPEVARMAVEVYGADIINDVSEGGITGVVDTPLDDTKGADGIPEIFKEMKRLRVPYILMSVQDSVEKMIENFRKEVAQLASLGVEKVILDPGYGFGKDVIKGNYEVLRRQKEIKDAFPELPLLAGMSRKRMIWQLLGGTAQDDSAMYGTMLVDMLALQNGADILRVHDVKQAVDTVKVFQAYRGENVKP